MKLTSEQIQQDLDKLPVHYKTADVDKLIRQYVKMQADVSALRPHILTHRDFYRIYFYVPLDQMKDVRARMAFIDENLIFNDWWHTDQVISYVADLPFDMGLAYAKRYIQSEDPFIRRWGYVLFISRLGRGHAKQLLPLMKDDTHYYVQMAEAWLIAELAIFEPEYVYQWLAKCGLAYSITGKAIQKIIDSFRVAQGWKEKFKKLRPELRLRK